MASKSKCHTKKKVFESQMRKAVAIGLFGERVPDPERPGGFLAKVQEKMAAKNGQPDRFPNDLALVSKTLRNVASNSPAVGLRQIGPVYGPFTPSASRPHPPPFGTPMRPPVPPVPKSYLLTPNVSPPRILKQLEITKNHFHDFANVDSGEMLIKKICVIGHENSAPPTGSQVWIRYAAYFLVHGNNKKWKLVEWSGKDPVSFILFRPKPQVIPAFDYTIGQMNIGEETYIKSCSDFTFAGDPEIEYPRVHFGCSCPALFLIQLVDFVEYPEDVLPFNIDTEENLTPVEQLEKRFYTTKRIAEEMKLLANGRFKAGDYLGSLQFYYKAAIILKRLGEIPKSCEVEAHALTFKLFNNMTSCAVQNEDYELALFFGDVCMRCNTDIPGSWHKLYYRLGKASFELGKLFEAKEYCIESLRLKRNNTECRNLFQLVLQRLHEDYAEMSNILDNIETHVAQELASQISEIKEPDPIKIYRQLHYKHIDMWQSLKRNTQSDSAIESTVTEEDNDCVLPNFSIIHPIFHSERTWQMLQSLMEWRW